MLSSCFFFSSRRRHTRFDCDWSSDVCSSDLYVQPVYVGANQMQEYPPDGIADSNRHNVAVYTHQLAERSEEHTSELQSQSNLVCRLLLGKKKKDEPTDLFRVIKLHRQQTAAA